MKKRQEAIYNKKYREANKEKIKGQRKLYRKANAAKIKLYRDKYYLLNKEKHTIAHKKWLKNNAERIKKVRRVRYENHREEEIASAKAWQAANLEKVKIARKAYNKANIKRLRVVHGKWKRKKYKNDAVFKLNANMSNAIRDALKGTKNRKTWLSLVPYTIEELKKHIQKLFTEGMTWDKYLKGEIHIDHKTPINVFNFTESEHEDFKRCWALKNLQPMWAKENIKKGIKLDKHFQPSLLL